MSVADPLQSACTQNAAATSPIAAAIDGLGMLDVDVLLSLGSAAGTELGELPNNVRVESFVDQAAVWPSVDLVVHHGGSGTLLGALAHGTPQLLFCRSAPISSSTPT